MTLHSYDQPVPPRRPPDQIADARAWAGRIRTASPAAFGSDHCGDPADVHDSGFRRWMRLPPIHHCQLRELACRQVAEARLGRQDPP
jgi:hypothetical protein